MQVSEIRFAVPTDAAEADLPRVASIIGAFDVTGLIIDGARVGAPGWVFARTLGDTADSTLLHFDTARDAATFLLPWATVREALVETFGTGVLVGTELDLGGGRKVLEDGLFAVGGEHAALAVLADRKDHMFGALATGVERDLIAARVADWIVVSGDGPAPDERLFTHLDDRMYDVALAGGGRAPALVLWRRGEFTHVALVRNGDIRQQLLWGPRWRNIEPASCTGSTCRSSSIRWARTWVSVTPTARSSSSTSGSTRRRPCTCARPSAARLPMFHTCSHSWACRRSSPRSSREVRA